MTIITYKILDHGSPEYKNAVALRKEILFDPLGLPFSAEETQLEKGHIHVAAFHEADVVGTLVLIPEGQHYRMRRVAVKPGYQDKGVGSQLMAFCESHAKAQKIESIYCHARGTAINFYRKNNYLTEGNYFQEADLPHIKMRKVLE